ncbi:MAG: HAD family hydrolase [Proteobacteria bacterium SG_bin7]|nr:MAG: HAD family hydrolase [Proteobacteria bacterium SG_bin7]
MKPISEFDPKSVEIVFTDIDDTLTDSGQLGHVAYEALWRLKDKGFKVVPVTGRPAGWCEMIARFWPVDAVVGENGAFYFMYKNKKMRRYFSTSLKKYRKEKRKLEKLEKEILKKIKGTAVASDQFCRLFDLAIDFCEDVKPLPIEAAVKIKKIFEANGAHAKISSIHVNGWFGNFNKLKTCLYWARQELGVDLKKHNKKALFVGDSPNDEPMFKFFENSFAVANIDKFLSQIEHTPKFVASKPGGQGFAEIVKRLCL